MVQFRSPDLSADMQDQEGLEAAQVAEPAEEVFVFPASFAQQRLWFLEQWEPGVYTISLAVDLVGDLEVWALERAFSEIVQRHEALRTTFRMDGTDLAQVVHPRIPFATSVIDLSMFPRDIRVVKIRRLINAEYQQTFDLLHRPLLRVTLIKSTAQKHTLLLSMHHIVSDGWSMEVVFNEFKQLYAAYVSEQPYPLAELTLQYADYAIWQRDWLQGEVLEEQVEYWRKRLLGTPALQLPFDHPRPATQTFHGAISTMVIPADLAAQLNALSRRAGMTLFMTLMGAFQTLLYRYTDQTSIPVGTPIAGRTDSKLEGLIGCFINTLVLNTSFSDNPTFWEVLRRVREVSLGAYEHQDIPFEKLVEMLQPGRDLSQNPLTQVMFTLQNVPQRETLLPRVKIVHLDMVEHEIQSALGVQQEQRHQAMIENKTAMFDLDLTVWERGEVLFGELKYNLDLFEPATINRLQEQFLVLLASIVANPMQHVAELSLLTSADRERLSGTRNGAEDVSFLARSFVEDFHRSVEHWPAALAVSDERETLSYRELNERADRLAVRLQKLGVGPEQIVGLYTRRGVNWAVAVLALNKIGGVGLPLDPHHPAARLRSVLQQSNCQLLLSSDELFGQLSDMLDWYTGEVCSLETLLARNPVEAEERPTMVYHPRHLAYVIFTSGSTGQPKGVMIEQQGMLNHLYAKVLDLGLDERDIVAQTASQCFDISVWQLLAAWLVGGQVRIYPDEVVADPSLMLEQLVRDGVSVLEGVPSWLRALLDIQQTSGKMVPLNRLRWVIPTGEALPVDLCTHWLRAYPEIPLLNAYGPTECSDDVTHQVVSADVELSAWGVTAPIGQPVANTRLYVLDRYGQTQPVGVWGELYIGGVGVGRGYLGNPARTAETFLPDAWSPEPGGRLYRAGDIGRYRADGSLEFQGRVDHQVKLRGYRIELGEIEQVLRRQPGVRDSVVAVKGDAPGRERLVGYVVLHPDAPFQREALQRALHEDLPEYMIPGALVALPNLPMTPNGKIDRQALPEPDEQERETGYIAPRTPLETQLASIWSELLGIERVSVVGDFFALGGHSLLTVRLVARIEKQFGKRLSLASVFQERTIEALAEVLQRSDTSLWSSEADQSLSRLDLPTEATLDHEVCPELWPEELPTKPASIFLSGATGFLGVFLLADLLRHTAAEIFCLVRARDAEQGQQKLQRALEEAGCWQSAYAGRIHPVVGDLAQPRLGLTPQAFAELARLVDTIYHNAAQVNMVYPYEQLKAANVGGTREIIRLATMHRIKPLHYVSTLSVLPHKGESRVQQVKEQDSLDDYHKYVRGGYAQSKWVAEKIITLARARGLPVTIYRPGSITGHSQSGVWLTEDVLRHVIKTCIQLGKYPFLPEDLMMLLPVDYVSGAIVGLSLRKASLGKTFHLCDTVGTKIPDILQQAQNAGYCLDMVELPAWLAALQQFAASEQANALSPLMFHLVKQLQGQAKAPVADARKPKIIYDNRNTVNGLSRTAISLPAMDARLIPVYLEAMVKSGFIPAPTGAAR